MDHVELAIEKLKFALGDAQDHVMITVMARDLRDLLRDYEEALAYLESAQSKNDWYRYG